MEKIISIIILCMSFSFSLNAQLVIAGNEQYNSYEIRTYIDNLNQRMIPKSFSDLYYSTIKQSDFKIGYQEIDRENKKRSIYIYSKKAKSGYLFINKSITNKLQRLRCNIDEITIYYSQNNKIISTKEQVNKLLKLKEKDILDLDISIDNQYNLLIVNVLIK